MNNLKLAFECTCGDRILNTVPDMPDHTFSKAFERKMAKLIKENNAKSRQPITVKKVMTYIIAAIMAAAIVVLTACAARYIYEYFIMDQHETHTRVSFAYSKDAPKRIEEYFAIDVPEGFEVMYEDPITPGESRSWADHIYINGAETIDFSQYTKHAYNAYVNTEGYTIEEVSVNGCDGFFVQMEGDNCYLAWDNGDYIFEISAGIGKNALFELAKSVHKVE